MDTQPQLEYESVRPRRPLGTARRLLATAGFLWFGFLLALAVFYFSVLSLADDSGDVMTVRRALGICARTFGAALPGLAVAVAALRYGR